MNIKEFQRKYILSLAYPPLFYTPVKKKKEDKFFSLVTFICLSKKFFDWKEQIWKDFDLDILENENIYGCNFYFVIKNSKNELIYSNKQRNFSVAYRVSIFLKTGYYYAKIIAADKNYLIDDSEKGWQQFFIAPYNPQYHPKIYLFLNQGELDIKIKYEIFNTEIINNKNTNDASGIRPIISAYNKTDELICSYGPSYLKNYIDYYCGNTPLQYYNNGNVIIFQPGVDVLYSNSYDGSTSQLYVNSFTFLKKKSLSKPINDIINDLIDTKNQVPPNRSLIIEYSSYGYTSYRYYSMGSSIISLLNDFLTNNHWEQYSENDYSIDNIDLWKEMGNSFIGFYNEGDEEKIYNAGLYTYAGNYTLSNNLQLLQDLELSIQPVLGTRWNCNKKDICEQIKQYSLCGALIYNDYDKTFYTDVPLIFEEDTYYCTLNKINKSADYDDYPEYFYYWQNEVYG